MGRSVLSDSGCTSDDGGASTGDADALAPSQITASTLARPATPPPCDPDDITTWTAQVAVLDDRADATLRLRNDGDAWCEVDVSASPLRGPTVEPDVWLEPGEWADLTISGAEEQNCATSTVVTLAQSALNGERRVVPTAVVQPCGWQLAAFFVNDTPSSPCGDGTLEFAITETALVVRNASSVPCVLGELVGVAGAEAHASDDPDAEITTVEITTLAAGDVVRFTLGPPSDTRCADGPTTLEFEVAGAWSVPGLGPCVTVEPGPARPWFDGPAGPLSGIDDPDAALAALDLF